MADVASRLKCRDTLSVGTVADVASRLKCRDTLSSGTMADVASRLPEVKFTKIALKLGFSYTDAQNIKTNKSSTFDTFCAMLYAWKDSTGGHRQDLFDVLGSVGLAHIVDDIKASESNNEYSSCLSSPQSAETLSSNE